MIENCTSMVTDLESGIAEVSEEWVGAVENINTEIVQIAMARVMQENVLAADESPSVAKGIATRFLCEKLTQKTQAEVVGSQSDEVELFSEEPLAVDNYKLKESHDRVPNVGGRERGECWLVSLCQRLPTRPYRQAP